MKRTIKLMAGTSLALALGVAGQIGLYHQDAPDVSTSKLHASWIFKPANVKQLQDRANSIALIKVVSVATGPDIVTPQAKEPGGVDRIPTRRVTVQVLESYKGSSKVGQRLTLFQTGGTVTPQRAKTKPAKGDIRETKVHAVILEGDPLYSVGEQDLVMLEAGPKGTMRTVSPEGRYRYDSKTGDLSPMVSTGVATEVSSKRLSTLAPALRGKSS